MRLTLAACLLLLAASPIRAANWPHWRGPHFNGSADETDLPSTWSTTEGVLWSADLEGPAASTPIVWDKRVFLSGTDIARDVLQAICFDRAGGKLLWKHDVARGIRRDHRRPVRLELLDGRRVGALLTRPGMHVLEHGVHQIALDLRQRLRLREAVDGAQAVEQGALLVVGGAGGGEGERAWGGHDGHHLIRGKLDP